MASNVVRFESFIFLDIETTGLGKPIEITELGLVAIQKRHLLAASDASSENEIRLPRICDKLQLCVRPQQEIEDEASIITRISDEDLSEKKPFDKQLACMIRGFCLRQPQPACLVAHLGDRFDFEVLAWQFTTVCSKFPSSILVSDSYKAFRKLYEATHGKSRGIKKLGIEGVSFSLSNLYYREMGRRIKGRYTVEGDSMALIELIVKKPEVLGYIESGAHPLGRGEDNQTMHGPRKRRKVDVLDLTLED